MKNSDAPMPSRLNSTASIFLIAAVIFLLAGLAVPSAFAQPPASTTHVVLVGGQNAAFSELVDMFTPSTLVIKAGDTVVWKDVGGPHTITSANVSSAGTPLFDSSPKFTPSPQFAAAVYGPGGYIKPGSSFVLNTTQLQPGTYKYQCTIHDMLGMTGALVVTNSTAAPGATSTVTVGWTEYGAEVTMFNPASLTVPRGTQVIFQSLSGEEPHNVVSESALSNGTVLLGTFFDSSPKLVPPGTTEAAVEAKPPPFPTGSGGVVLPGPGSTYNYTFTQPGTYIYYCKLHSTNLGPMAGMVMVGMVGQIIVLPGYATQQSLDATNSQVSNATAQLGSAQSSASQASSQASTATYISYAAIGIAVVLGIAALALSLRRAR